MGMATFRHSSQHRCLLYQETHHSMRLHASRNNKDSSKPSMDREVEVLVQRIEQQEAQLQASYSDQNELLHRLERALCDLEMVHAQNLELTSQNQELASLNDSLRVHMEALNTPSDDLTYEQISRIAAEKALQSSKEFLEIALQDLKRALAERDSSREEIVAQHKQITQLEEDVILASRDAKDSLHREMELLAEVEDLKECISGLRSENDTLRTRLIEAQSKASFSSLADKNKDNGHMHEDSETDDLFEASETVDPEIVSDVAIEAKKRSYEIRAEAALLVETVEDRASELVEKAQREVAILKAELKKVTGSSSDEA
jgi:chromosome segregation ATPase